MTWKKQLSLILFFLGGILIFIGLLSFLGISRASPVGAFGLAFLFLIGGYISWPTIRKFVFVDYTVGGMLCVFALFSLSGAIFHFEFNGKKISAIALSVFVLILGLKLISKKSMSQENEKAASPPVIVEDP